MGIPPFLKGLAPLPIGFANRFLVGIVVHMDEVPIPFVDENIDAGNPMKALMTIATIVVGFGIFAMAQGIGSNLGARVNSALGTLIGFNPATGETEGVDLV